MTTFSYKAADATGKVVHGVLEADGEKAVVARLHELGYIPIRIQTGQRGLKFLQASASRELLLRLKRVTGKDVQLFTQDLATLLDAGLPVDKALGILAEVAENEKFQGVVKDILRTVQGGSYLSDALRKYPRAFSSFYVNMVKAGEAGGVLEAVLTRLGVFLEGAQDLRDFVKSAMIYPAFLVLVGGASIIILMTFVIPKFSIIFADLGQAIPLSTQFLLGTSRFLRGYWFLLLAGVGLAVLGLRRFTATPEGRFKIDVYKMKTPVVGEMVRRMEVARFARTLGTLTSSGVPILQALNLVKDILGNRVIARSMIEVYERVKEGERLSRPLSDTGFFPPLAIQMITIGEETGRLDDMLLRVAENYEKVVRTMVKRFISLLEPAMILFMGVVVGFIVISMLMAIFSVNEMPF